MYQKYSERDKRHGDTERKREAEQQRYTGSCALWKMPPYDCSGFGCRKSRLTFVGAAIWEKKKRKHNEGVYKYLVTVLRATEGGELKEAEGQRPSTTTIQCHLRNYRLSVAFVFVKLSYDTRRKKYKRQDREWKAFLWWLLFWHHSKHFEVNQRFSGAGKQTV